MPKKMNNEQKIKLSSSIVSIACSTLNTQITTTTSTTTTPTTWAGPHQTLQQLHQHTHQHQHQPAKHQHSKSSAAASSASSSISSIAVGKPVTASSATCKTAFSSSRFAVSPMSDAAAAGQQHGPGLSSSINITTTNSDKAATAAAVAILKQDVQSHPPICTIASVDIAANTPALVTANSTPKVAATETTTNSNNNNSSGGNASNSTDKSKKSETFEEKRLKELDDTHLKNLLEEAYNYKNPRDKANKSEMFLELLEKVENETEDSAFHAIAYTRNSVATASNSHKQGGSLQDLVDAVRNESQLDCDYNFGVGGQRNRRHNHNSRQKKYSSVSSRQREGGSLPSNVNVTYCGGANLLSALEQQQPVTAPAFMNEMKISNSSSQIIKQQRRSKAVNVEKDFEQYPPPATAVAAAGGGGGGLIVSDSATTSPLSSVVSGATFNCAATGADCVIEMDEPMMDIQQQQKILHAKGLDSTNQNLPYYERLENVERIPRANIISSLQTKTNFATTSSQCYVDEAARNNGSNSNSSAGDSGNVGGVNIAAGGGLNKISSTIDTKCLPLDENYKSCKSLLGEKSDPVNKAQSAMFSTTKTMTRQFDENGNSLNEVHQQSCKAVILNASTTGGGGGGGNPTTSQSQAKAKNKNKRSQQDRNTKTVDVKSIPGYCGEDPLEVLVKYIESSEDKQNDKSSSNSNKFNDNNKKKERKKDKEKGHKMKKSNSLEELRSCAKIDVGELKETAATTESNVMMRNKTGGNGGGGGGGTGGKNKNSSSSAADINKNFDSKELSTAVSKMSTIANTAAAQTSGATGGSNINNRKGERRSWGTEELQFLGGGGGGGNACNTEDKSINKEKKNSKNKEKDYEKEKDKDEKSKEKNDFKNNNTTDVIITTSAPITTTNKVEKNEKRKKSEASNSTICRDEILAIETLLPEAAEFHVVTKKKKPKKQRLSLDENHSGGPNNNNASGIYRNNNFMSNMKNSTAGVGGAQRYKYYNSHGANTTTDYLNTYTSHHAHNQNVGQNIVGDKSRRKSTSSMPPSEKSDSSDLDSVHSLPIETTTSAKSKQRHKNNAGGGERQEESSDVSATKIGSSPAPISYADIARTNKEQQQTPIVANSNDNAMVSNAQTNASAVDHHTPPSEQSEDNLRNTTQSTSSVPSPPSAMTATAATATVPATNKHKPKKSASKPDFPELPPAPLVTTNNNNDMTTVVTSGGAKANNFKQISYSQSLSTTPTNVVSELVASTATVEKENPATDKRAEIISIPKADSANHINVRQQQQQVLPNVSQQQPLQKSKSVDHESYKFSNSNMDQQYPALEKTVKRHSSTVTVCSSSGGATGAQFNFAAAAKHQQQQNNEEFLINTNATSNAAAANVNKQILITTTTSFYAASNNAAATAASNVAIKKNKDKPPMEILPSNNQSAAPMLLRKNKKEKHNQIHANESPAAPTVTTTHKSTTATQTATCAGNASNSNRTRMPMNIGTNISNSKSIASYQRHTNAPPLHAPSNRPHKSNHISKHISSTAAGNSNTTSNRPAVIILNDDRTMGRTVANNEFTFGDFNEDELKFFDDDIGTADDINEDEFIDDYNDGGDDDDMIDCDEDDIEDIYVEQTFDNIPPPAESCTKTIKTLPKARAASNTQAPTIISNLNDSGANFNTTSASSTSSTSDVGVCGSGNNSNNALLNTSAPHVDDIILVGAADASSPNTSLQVVGNQSSDSGIYAGNKLQATSKSPTRDVAKATTISTSTVSETNNLNTFLTTEQHITIPSNGNPSNTTTANGASGGGVLSSIPQQQLETCNDIETAIIAAAKAAAEQQHHHQQPQQQQSHHLQQQQQQQNYKQPVQPNSNSSSASSSFSSSSVSMESKYPYPPPPQQHHQNHYYHQHQYKYNYVHQTSEDHARSRSSSSQRDDASAAAQRKEFDMHNEIIIDFIGSAWEEVANSKVTKFYDGQ